MSMWNPKRRRISESEQRAVEEQAASDARERALRIWQEGSPCYSFEPIADEATDAYIARISQESRGIPRWAWFSKEAQREYLRLIDERYYYAFLEKFSRVMGDQVYHLRGIPHTTPLPVESRITLPDDIDEATSNQKEA